MCRIHLASWAGALHTSTVQSKAGWWKNNFFPDLKTHRKCRRSLRLLVHQLTFLVQPRNYHQRKDIGTILELVAVQHRG